VSQSKQPHNAVIFISSIAALLLCTQLPSQVAFYSLTSISAAGSLAAYGVVGFGRAFLTRKTFQPSFWDLGKFGVLMAIATFLWTGFAFAVLCSPQYGNASIDEDSSLFNYCIVIMAGVTVIALEEWWRKSRNVWFGNLQVPTTGPQATELVHPTETGRNLPGTPL
jgi:amino acid transporter